MSTFDSAFADRLEACHRGDPAAQKKLYEDYYRFARKIARRYAKNESETEEIIQDAFLKLFLKLEEERFEGHFEKWFRRVVINAGIDYYRKFQRYRLVLRLPTLKAVANLAVEELEKKDVYLLLQQLSPKYRMVFNLHDLEGFTHAEIAEELGISVGTSKSNLARARRKLKDLLGAYFDQSSIPSNA